MLSTRSLLLNIAAMTGSVLIPVAMASAQTVLTDFSDFTLGGSYGSWSIGDRFDSGAEEFTVNSIGYGGGFYDIDPNADATGNTVIEMDVTINLADEVAGLGIILVLVDEDLTQFNYGYAAGDFPGWFGLLPGQSYTLTASIDDYWTKSAQGDDGELDVSDLTFFHLQIDPGTNTGDFYEVVFDELRIVSPVALLSGDANGDGSVDLLDLSILATNFGQSGSFTNAEGDFNGDAVVDLLDLSILAQNFGMTATVPEPVSGALLAIGGLGILRRRMH